jgi:hypothetical protein
MGAWAEDAFGNDTACDWAGDFAAAPSFDQVEAAIDRVLASEAYLDADEACECLVACEIIARLKGNWGAKNSYSEGIDQWVDSVTLIPSQALVSKAKQAISRILAENSELQELWDEEGYNDSWHEQMHSLLERVTR